MSDANEIADRDSRDERPSAIALAIAATIALAISYAAAGLLNDIADWRVVLPASVKNAACDGIAVGLIAWEKKRRRSIVLLAESFGLAAASLVISGAAVLYRPDWLTGGAPSFSRFVSELWSVTANVVTVLPGVVGSGLGYFLFVLTLGRIYDGVLLAAPYVVLELACFRLYDPAGMGSGSAWWGMALVASAAVLVPLFERAIPAWARRHIAIDR